MPLAHVITGIGLVTPLGVGLDATWRAINDGRFITDVGRVPVDRVSRVSRVAQLGLIAAREAIAYRDVGDAALLVGTSKGPADEWLRDPTTALGLSTVSDEIAAELEIAGSPRLTLSAACASGLHALVRATMLLERGDVARALVIASESSLHPIWHGTFKRLGVLAPPGEPGRPFDEDRHGVVISEAAAALVVDRREPQPGDLVIERAAIAADATHLTGSDCQGRSLSALVERVVGDHAAAISFVHAHATGTAVDAIELDVIRRTVGAVSTYSHKGTLGHTLGAAGLVAVALSAKVHAARMLPPMPTLRVPLAGLNRSRELDAKDCSLILASGFGGALAAVKLRHV